ncbi:MAG: helix-turn-helix transcriptional regulator [Proteobacteria bacterium]|nr:helix-turn-helix transcriptional regulator [Pseudomonadota bacterium]
MITPEQIKAARALLKWKQSDLATASGLSLPSINNIERAIGSPRVDTMAALQTALENGGIQFTSGRGVCLRDEVFEVHKYEGDDFIRKQNDDLFSCMHSPADDALMCGLDERKFVEYAPDQVTRYDRYQKKTRFTERILIRTDDTFFLANPHVYRWISPQLIGTIPYLVYKDRFVMIMWESRRVVIIRNQSIADTFRKQFDFLWNLAAPVPPGHSSKIRDSEIKK